MKSIRDSLPGLLIPPVIAVTFLTCLPVYWLLKRLLPETLAGMEWNGRYQSLSTLWYPLVGLLLAVLIFLPVSLLPASTPVLLQALVIAVLWVLLTGALHLDGLADSVDAASAAHRLSATKGQQEKILQVFRDPAAGPMAVVALVLVILLKVILLASLLPTLKGTILPALITALVLSRTLALALMASTPYVRSAGSASTLVAGLPKLRIYILAFFCGLSTFFFLPFAHALTLLILLTLLVFWWRRLWLRTIGGYVGDCVGALIELAEVLTLLVLCYWSYA